MTAKRETSRSIDDSAADWTARLDRGALSDEESQVFDAWLNGDPRRRGALLRAGAVAMLSESARALGPQFDPKAFAAAPRPHGLSRRKLIGLAAAGGTVAAIAGIGFTLPAAAITTGLGEVRLVTLEDGSTVMLNTQSGVRVRYGARERSVELLYGEAFFTILADPARPFFVDLPGKRLRTARGTVRVRKLHGRPLDILVDQGSAEVVATNAAAALQLPASSRLTFTLATPLAQLPLPQPVGPDLVQRELAWREGKIAFEGEPLEEAAASFARYSRMRIEVRDAALAHEPVAGLFSASDPLGFSRAVARLFDAEMEQRGDMIMLRRRAAHP